jgi:hypothetical protein
VRAKLVKFVLAPPTSLTECRIFFFAPRARNRPLAEPSSLVSTSRCDPGTLNECLGPAVDSPGGGIQHHSTSAILGLFLDHATIFASSSIVRSWSGGGLVSDQHDVDAPHTLRKQGSGLERCDVTPDPVPLLGALDGCAAAPPACVASCLNRRRPEGVCGADDHAAAVNRRGTSRTSPMVVVLPTPLTLTTSTTVDGRWSVSGKYRSEALFEGLRNIRLRSTRVGRAESLDAARSALQ